MNESVKDYLRFANHDNDIDQNLECAKTADNFSHQIIQIIIKDDPSAFIDIASKPEFDHDGTLLLTRERFFLSDYLYQPFFDELTGPTVLSVAAFFRAEKIVQCILDLSIVDTTDAFHFACAGGSLNIVRLLFSEEEKDRINKDNIRPLTIASYFGNLDVVKYLWSHNCPIINPLENNSCINKAAFNGNINILEFFRGVDPNYVKKMKNYCHPINSAAMGGQPEVVKYLLKYGNPNRQDIYEALLSSSSSGSLSCVKILLEQYLNLMQNQPKKAKRRKKKDDDDDYNPDGKKSKKAKKDNYDDDDNNENNDIYEQEFLNICYQAISHLHLDVIHYLIKKKQINSVDSLVSFAISNIPYDTFLKRTVPSNYLYYSSNQELKDSSNTTFWLKNSEPSIQMAKFILKSCSSIQFNDLFFEKVTKNDMVQKAIYFLNEINFKITENFCLSKGQIEFFQLAILMSNIKTIPMIKNIFNNTEQDIFDKELFEPLRDKKISDVSDPNYYYNDDDEDDDEDEKLSSFVKERIMHTFNKYLSIISNRKFEFSPESALFLIENNFPYYILTDNESNFPFNPSTIFLPFFIACLRLDLFEYAKKFLLLTSPKYFFDALLEIIEIVNKKFNVKYNPKSNEIINMRLLKNNRYNGAFKHIYEFNQNKREKEEESEFFNIFDYKYQNEKEKDIYDQYISLIKMIIRISSHNTNVALLLCLNGLSIEWIILNIRNESHIINTLKQHKPKRIKKRNNYKPFDFFLSFSIEKYYTIKDDWYLNSLNPLMNFAPIRLTCNSNYNYVSKSKEIIETLKFYLFNGIDATICSDDLWKKVIDNKNGWMSRLLIQYGNADKNTRIKVSGSDDLSLIDYVILKKVPNIMYVYLENDFYPDDSLINTDPNKLVMDIEKEPVERISEERKNNLKIILLIYKYKSNYCYDNDLKEKVMKELNSMVIL